MTGKLTRNHREGDVEQGEIVKDKPASVPTHPATPRWDAARISDATYRSKFFDLPDHIRDWTAPYGGVAGRAIMDFGCGEATTAVGLALRHGAGRVVGIEIGPDPERCAGLAAEQLGLDLLPANLFLHRVRPGDLHDPADRFDVIYSWSVFEHVEQSLLPGTLAMLRAALNPGGVMLIQIAPLYYSANGSHLMPWVAEPWGHLINQANVYLDKLSAACNDSTLFTSLRSMYETLNRLTADQLVKHIEAAGFEILRQHRTDCDFVPPPGLDTVFHRDVLLNEQVVLLLRPR
jgi:SAM-dependent methyltransferase